MVESGHGHQFLQLDNSKDWRVYLPTTGPQRGGLDLRGGHNLIIIGGEIDLTYPCDDSRTACHGINVARSSTERGQLFVEGVLIKNPDPNYLTDKVDTGDGIDVNNYAGITDIVLENVRIQGIKGCDPANPSAHADVFQPYNAPHANLLVDHLTGTSDCQGFQVDPTYSWQTHGMTPTSGVFKNVNLNAFVNPNYGGGNAFMWWFTVGTTSCVSYPITLANVYTREPNASLLSHAVWPNPGYAGTAACAGVYSSELWSSPTLRSLIGGIHNGLPPASDFVPAGVAGINYVSPGYR